MIELRIVENQLFEQVRNWSGVMKAEQIVIESSVDYPGVSIQMLTIGVFGTG
jgi:hypothetical protein